MDVPKFYEQLVLSLEKNPVLQAIRSGLLTIIPILLIGSFSLGLRSFPISAYQNFITSFGEGCIYSLFTFLHDATFGFLSFYTAASISISYSAILAPAKGFSIGPLLVSISCFTICSGATADNFQFASFGAEGMFTAILCSLLATHFFLWLTKRFGTNFTLTADGADMEFTGAISMFLQVAIVITTFVIVNTAISFLFHTHSINQIFSQTLGKLFADMGRTLGSSLFFVFLSSVLWFFGLHGSNILKNVSDTLFLPALATNQELLAAGSPPTEIVSREFFEVFVMLGGCGSAMCLLVALLLFSKRKSNQRLVKFSSFTILFNINEPLIFGLPIILNPLMFIPFVLTPLVNTVTSYFAMSLQLVPMATQSVLWTTPIFFSGYAATGSIAGSILQLINLVLGVLIYCPFVLLYDNFKVRNSQNQMQSLIHILQESEKNLTPVSLLYLHGAEGLMARSLSEDLKESLEKKSITMFFQPQFNNADVCVGAEALLRWHHPQFGYIYPPLIIKLAEESHLLTQLEETVFQMVAQQLPLLQKTFGQQFKISINVSAQNIQSTHFESFLIQLAHSFPLHTQNIFIEITEQTAFECNDVTLERIQHLKDSGYHFALDDFSMGNTSVKYLQNNIFDIVKLDGSLVSDVIKNKRSADIIASIAALSTTLGIDTVAEYVETREQKNILEFLGCLIYQGYLYSPAIPCEDFVQRFSTSAENLVSSNANVKDH